MCDRRMQTKNKRGWIPDRPDARDMVPHHLPAKGTRKKPAASCDLRKQGILPPVEDQGEIGSCTAHAVIGVLETALKKNGQRVDLSRRFLYKVTRNFLGWQGDQGAFLRTTMKAAIMIGAPPESHWPYDVKRYDDEPSSFVYSVAQNFRALKYLNVGLEKHDEKRLSLIKTSIEAGLPVAFGFTVYDTIDDETGVVSMPSRTSKSEGGHAVFAVGYDDKRGQLLFQNSWGKQWGDGGYGWLPYEYVTSGLAEDFWTVVDMSWIDLPQFE